MLTYVSTYTYTCTSTCSYAHAHTHSHAHTHAHTRAHTHTNTCICMYTHHSHKHTHMHVYVHVYIHVSVQTHTHAPLVTIEYENCALLLYCPISLSCTLSLSLTPSLCHIRPIPFMFRLPHSNPSNRYTSLSLSLSFSLSHTRAPTHTHTHAHTDGLFMRRTPYSIHVPCPNSHLFHQKRHTLHTHLSRPCPSLCVIWHCVCDRVCICVCVCGWIGCVSEGMWCGVGYVEEKEGGVYICVYMCIRMKNKHTCL